MKLDKVVDLDNLSKLIDFGFKRSRVRGIESSFRTSGTPCTSVERMQLPSSIFAEMQYWRLLPADQKLCPNAADVIYYNSL